MMRCSLLSSIFFITNIHGAHSTIRGGKNELSKFAFQCVVEGWEKPDCLATDGCTWCLTKDYGGACVTDSFADRVKSWSYFECDDDGVEEARHVDGVSLA